MLTSQQVPATQRLKITRETQGQITQLLLNGVVDEGFDGKKLAESIKTRKILVNFREVRRFASWGMAEWSEFLRLNAERDIYIIECSSQALGQFNLVTGLLGTAKLLSFYASYRCSKCGEESPRLFVLPTDRDEVATLDDSSIPCPTCGGLARFDKYALNTMTALGERPPIDVDDEVITYLRTTLDYNIVPDLTRFRAYRSTTKDHTYLRLSGSLATMPSELVAAACDATTVVDLAQVLPLDTHGHNAWRAFVTAATPRVKSLQLLDCPSDFLERAVLKADLDKVKVRSFALAYHCTACGNVTTSYVDVAAQLEYLVMGTLPVGRCSSCKASVEATPSPDLLDIVRRLPAREHNVALDKFLEKVRAESNDKLQDATVPIAKPATVPPTAAAPKALYIAIGLMAVVAAGVGVLALTIWKDRDDSKAVTRTDQIVPPKPTTTFQRPDWIVSDLPSSAFCQDLTNRLTCVGVSSYRATRDEGVAEANDAALDELAVTLGLRITTPAFRELVLPAYSGPRAKALTALQDADVDRSSDTYKKANAIVRDARKRVADALKASGGPAVPAQRSDWYWEEYAVEKGGGTEVLVFVRYDVPMDVVKTLQDHYAAEVDIGGGAKAMTAFPALGWRGTTVTGAMLVEPGRKLRDAGATRGDIITEVDGTAVTDAGSLAKRLAAGGPMKGRVMTIGGEARDLDLSR